MANNKNITFDQLQSSMTKVKNELNKKANNSHGTHVDYYDDNPKVAGTTTAGSSSKLSRGDHVHPAQTTITGNAGTATKLANARTLTIGNTGKTFDGSRNVSWSLSEIGAAAASHGHNYLDVKGNNTINSTANDTTAKWGAQRNSVHWYTTASLLNGQPSQWGYLVNIGQDSEVHQVWMTQASGDLLHRGGNSSGWNGSWKTILDSSNYSTWAAAKSHTHTNLTTKTVSSGTLTLGTELYQYAAITSNNTIINLPSVSSFTEIHLFFDWPSGVSITMPSNVKWQEGVMYGPGHTHEFVFTYVNSDIGWLGGCVVYG